MVTDYTCELSGFPGSQGIEIYDRVTVTHPLPGWTAKDFIIRSKSEDELGRPKFQMEAYFEGLYTGEMAEPQSGYASYLPSPNITPSQVTGLTVTDASGWASDGWYIPKVNVTYTKPDNSAFWKAANLYLSNDDATWNFAGADYDGTGNVLLTSLANVETGATVFVKALSVNEMGIQAPDNESAATKSLFLYLPDIQATLDNIPDGGSGRFIFPKGIYYQTSAVSVPDKRIELHGMQREGVIFVNNSASPMFQLYNRTKYFETGNFTVSSANTTISSGMITATGSAAAQNTADMLFYNVTFDLYYNGVYGTGGVGDQAFLFQTGNPNSVRIQNCRINSGKWGLYNSGYDNIIISDNIFYGQSYSSVFILSTGDNGLNINNNQFFAVKNYGIYVSCSAKGILIDSNLIFSFDDGVHTSWVGIYGVFDSGQITNNIINLSTSSTTVQSFGIYSNSERFDDIISNNTVDFNISSDQLTFGIYGLYSDSQLISNKIKIDNDNNSNNHCGIYLTNDRNIVSSNNINMVNSNSRDYGIYLSTSVDTQISGNNFYNVLDYNMIYDTSSTGNRILGNTGSDLQLPINTGSFVFKFL